MDALSSADGSTGSAEPVEELAGRVRATGAGFVFNVSRIPAALGVLIAGALIVYFGGYGNAATTIATVYLRGLVAAPFLPETIGKRLPA